MDTLQWAYKEGRREKREKREVRGWRARARPRGDSAVCPLSREEGEEGRG